MRVKECSAGGNPDFASLHPGYIGTPAADFYHLIACGLMDEPVPPVITSGGPQKKNS